MERKMPGPEEYEQVYAFMPYGELIEKVCNFAVDIIPYKGYVLDLMCGTGYLLNKLREKRTDIRPLGIDNNPAFCSFGNLKYGLGLAFLDVLHWTPTQNFYDMVLCTAGLHHLPYEKQELFLRKIFSTLKEHGFGIIADPYIGDYSSEEERKRAATELGYNYLLATLEKNPSEGVLREAVDILFYDIAGYEYKTSLAKMLLIFKNIFPVVHFQKSWPDYGYDFGYEYGEYIVIVRKGADNESNS